MFTEEIKTIQRLGFRHVRLLSLSSRLVFLIRLIQLLLQILNFANVLTTALMLWKGLSVIMNSESPIVVVLR
jgi:signal peptidase I